MANITLTYVPTRKLVDPPPTPDVEIDLVLEVMRFEPTYEQSLSEAKSKGGKIQASEYYDTETFAVKVVPDSVPRDQMEMYLASVRVREEHKCTNPNEGDREMTVQLMSRNRERFGVKLDNWNYEFVLREVV